MTTYTVRAFLNDLTGGARRYKETDEERERYEKYRAGVRPERIPYCDGYAEGDPLIESRLSPLEVEAEDVYGALEEVFYEMNKDTRANGPYERSLSVGDVCEVDGKRYAVAGMGFEAIQERAVIGIPR